MFKILSTYSCWKNIYIYKMQHLEDSGTPVLYIGRTFLKRLNRLYWFGHVQRMEENKIPKRMLCIWIWGTARLRGRLRNRWQDGGREDGRIVGGDGWWEEVHNREEWKKLLRTARNRHILYVPMEWMNVECYLPRLSTDNFSTQTGNQ
jgi:hypothetical protein